MKTPVSILQEFCTRNQIIPQYDLTCNDVGTHNPNFEYRLTVQDVVAYGNGKSKKEAKQDAAKKAVNLLPIGRDGNQSDSTTASTTECTYEDVSSPYQNDIKRNSVCELFKICGNKTLPKPEYYLVGQIGAPHAKTFTYECCVSKYKERGASRTKQQAKHLSAIKMIERLLAVFGSEILENTETEESVEVEKACKIYGDLNQVHKRKTNWDENFSICLSEFSFKFENSSFLNDLISYKANINENSVDPCEFLINLVGTSGKNVIFELIPSENKICYACKLDFSPHFVTFGSGTNEVEARIQSAHKMLLTLKDFS